MRPKILLRIAAIVMLLHDLGHTIGHSGWRHATDPAKQGVIDQMTTKQFPFMGAVHSMGDYYEGYGYASSLALLLISAILWIVSDAAGQNAIMARKIIICTAIILGLWGTVELIYFFPFAASFTFLSMLLITIAYFRLHKND